MSLLRAGIGVGVVCFLIFCAMSGWQTAGQRIWEKGSYPGWWMPAGAGLSLALGLIVLRTFSPRNSLKRSRRMF